MCAFVDIKATDFDTDWQEELAELIYEAACRSVSSRRTPAYLERQLRLRFGSGWTAMVSDDPLNLDWKSKRNFLYAVVGTRAFLVCRTGSRND
ncbi:hypothetical protein CRM22_006411 [Opisthorchis felineus]|uniref:Dynein light chain n=1 Tax=Opisthorchis felineus TaxID=147828 RepID=A0A4S2LSF8_OPIFE|nr:hypothetical protein CRM22_006411 [Opisthorchis felineus]